MNSASPKPEVEVGAAKNPQLELQKMLSSGSRTNQKKKPKGIPQLDFTEVSRGRVGAVKIR